MVSTPQKLGNHQGQLYTGTLIQKAKSRKQKHSGWVALKHGGFQELSILARRFAIFTLEGRAILDRNSFLTLPFFDVARIKVSANGSSTWKTAMALGMGLNLAPGPAFSISPSRQETIFRDCHPLHHPCSFWLPQCILMLILLSSCILL